MKRIIIISFLILGSFTSGAYVYSLFYDEALEYIDNRRVTAELLLSVLVAKGETERVVDIGQELIEDFVVSKPISQEEFESRGDYNTLGNLVLSYYELTDREMTPTVVDWLKPFKSMSNISVISK